MDRDAILFELQQEVHHLLARGSPDAAVSLAMRYLRHFEDDATAISVVADCLFACAGTSGAIDAECNAIVLVERAIQLEPHNPRWVLALGDMYATDNALPANHKRAAEIYMKAIQIDNRIPEPFSRLAGLYGSLPELTLEDALAYARTALEKGVQPVYLELFRYARLLELAGQPAEALVYCRDSLAHLEQEPADPYELRERIESKVAELEHSSG